MISSALVALFLSVVSVTAEPRLLLKVSGEPSVNGVENLKVIATLKNTGNETLRLLNDPRSALTTTPTNAFKISNVNGTSPTFTGVKVKYAPRAVVGFGRPESFTILAPGKEIKIEHDLSAAYNFTQGGMGAYNIKPHNLFLYVDPKTNTTQRIFAQTISYKAVVKGRLSVARRSIKSESRLVKRARFRGCNDEQVKSIFQGARAAKEYVDESLAYLQSSGGRNASERYTTWWGESSEDRQATLVKNFGLLARNDYMGYNYDCTCDETDVFAFVYPDDFGTVHLCGAFWNSPVKGQDSKGGTIVHESTHFTKNIGTDDHAYGHEACQALAKEDPDIAITNADSHEYFVENDPQLE